MKAQNIYIFSTVTDETIALALSLDKEHAQKATAFFFSGSQDAAWFSYIAKYPRLQCKRFKLLREDIEHYLKATFSHKVEYCVVLMGADENNNLKRTLSLNELFGTHSNMRIFCLATSAEAECLIDNCNITNSKKCESPARILRLHPERMEVYEHLYVHSLFDDAVTINDERWINLIIIGLGKYGMEMLRGSLWCAQMEGYYIRIDVFDVNPKSEDEFKGSCPGIVQRGNQPRMGEDYYDIHFHNCSQYGAHSFFEDIGNLPTSSRIIVDTTSDEQNASLAMQLRSYYAGRDIDHGILPIHASASNQVPRIIAVLRDDIYANMFQGNMLTNFRGQYYQIECLGNTSSVYSSSHLINSQLLKIALLAHQQYGSERDFWMYEYFRRSSIATAIHKKYRDELLNDPTVAAIVEHRRWSAYMRSTEGYQYGVTRDDLAKRHPSLTAYDNLSKVEQAKDFSMNQVSFSL